MWPWSMSGTVFTLVTSLLLIAADLAETKKNKNEVALAFDVRLPVETPGDDVVVLTEFFNATVETFPIKSHSEFVVCVNVLFVDKNNVKDHTISKLNNEADVQQLQERIKKELASKHGNSSYPEEIDYFSPKDCPKPIGTPAVIVRLKKVADAANWEQKAKDAAAAANRTHLVAVVSTFGNGTVRGAVLNKTMAPSWMGSGTDLKIFSTSMANAVLKNVRILLERCDYTELNGHCSYQKPKADCARSFERKGQLQTNDTTDKQFCLTGRRFRYDVDCTEEKCKEICDKYLTKQCSTSQCGKKGKILLIYKDAEARFSLGGCGGGLTDKECDSPPCPSDAGIIALIVVGGVLLVLLVAGGGAAYWFLCRGAGPAAGTADGENAPPAAKDAAGPPAKTGN